MGLKVSSAAADIDDTEDYINIELDNHRNQLIRVRVYHMPWLGLTVQPSIPLQPCLPWLH